MAWKRIAGNTAAGQLNFEAEQRILQQFKSCLENNKNIMQSFASFVHGPDFIILSRWADGRDLHLFLTKPDEILDNYPAKSIRFSPDNLLTEAYNLARALHFLHFGMATWRGKQLRCAHLDLKPSNILVEFLPEEQAHLAPVGRWKIADFGLSKVEVAVEQNQYLPIAKEEQDESMAPGNIPSFLPPTRGPGAFQPPEVHSNETAKVSTRRDVWSYGCILAMVLAFALGGPSQVRAQGRARATGGDDFFYRRQTRRSTTPNAPAEIMAHSVDAELKPPVRRWLERASSLADEVHRDWIQNCSELIFTLLDVNVLSRPEIAVAVSTLDSMTDVTELFAAYRLWGFEDPSRLPEPIIVAPSEPSSMHTDAHHLPLSPNHSPQSSGSGHVPRRASRHNSQRSSGGSSTIFYTVDPTISFVRLISPDRCQGTALESSGQIAALWSSREIKTLPPNTTSRRS